MRSTSAAVALTALLAAASAAAQQRQPGAGATVLEGLTVDSRTGLPFPNVQLRFDSGQRVTSDAQGRYHIRGVPAGHHRIALVTGRCNVTFAAVDIADGAIKRVAFSLPTEVATGPTHEELKKRSDGQYYSSADLEKLNARNLLEALRRVAPDMVGPQSGLPGAPASLMSRTRTAQGVVPPIVTFDGIQVADGVRSLRDFNPADVESMEILKGASRGWEYGTGGAGGVIRVLTKQGGKGLGVQDPDGCDIGDWTGTGGGASPDHRGAEPRPREGR